MEALWLTTDAWLESHQGLIAVVLGIAALAFGIPATVQSVRALRDRHLTSDELTATLRATGGRVSGPRLQNEAVGFRDVLPIQIRVDDGEPTDGVLGILSTLADGESILALGEGGAGKSELLHQVHLESYRSSDPASPLVEVVSLAAFPGGVRGRRGVVRWAVRQVASRYRRSPAAMSRLVDETRIVIAFDALDEASEAVRAEVVTQLVAWSATHPTVVTSRASASSNVDDPPSEAQLGRARRVRTAYMQALDTQQIVTALRATPATNLQALIDAAHVFANPLRLQLLLFTARARALADEEVRAIVTDSHALLARVVRGVDGRSGTADPALRFAVVLSADVGKDQGTAFRLVPFAFTGVAMWISRAIVLAFLAWLAVSGFPTTSIVLGCSVLVASTYEWQNPVFRAVRAVMPNAPDWVAFIVRAALAFVFVHVVRITVTSLYAGALATGDAGELISWYWAVAALWCFLISEESPFSGGSYVGYTRYLETRAWPQFAVGGLLGALAVLAAPALGAVVLGPFVAIWAACASIAVSFIAAWIASSVPPWRWRATAVHLVRRGVLSQSGRHFKFVHADVEQHLLWEAAADPAVPRSVWRLFGRHWVERMLDRRLGRTGVEPGRTADEVIDLLSRRFAWSPLVVNAMVPYLSWTRMDPDRTLAFLRRHDRAARDRGRDPRLVDAMDRTGDPEGLDQALGRLDGARTKFEAHWLLRVLERHGDDPRVVSLLDRLGTTRRSKDRRRARRPEPDVAEFVAQRIASGRGPSDSASEPVGDMVAWCRRLADEAPTLAVANARIAQAAYSADLLDPARSIAVFAVDTVGTSDTYDCMVEVMMTAAVIAREPVAEQWLHRAAATGLTVVDRTDLAARLPRSAWDGLLLPRRSAGRQAREDVAKT